MNYLKRVLSYGILFTILWAVLLFGISLMGVRPEYVGMALIAAWIYAAFCPALEEIPKK